MLRRCRLWGLVMCLATSIVAMGQGSALVNQPPTQTAAAAEAKANAALGQTAIVPHMIAPPPDEPYQMFYGAHIQRSMTLLEASNKEEHWPVRILLYGQSIVGSASLTEFLGTYFAQRYPNAEITFENRAIGGFGGDKLVRTSAEDLYPFYPDLMIFHVYGGQRSGDVERIFTNLRRYTTSDCVIFNDHKNRDQEISESSIGFWKMLASKYDCELVDLSTEWPRYLREHSLKPAQLLRDAVHPSVDGYAILAQLVERHLRYNPIFSDPWFNRVRRYEARRPLVEATDEITLSGDGWVADTEGIVGSLKGDRLHLEFEGNRVDLIAPHLRGSKETGGTATVLIDGKAPSRDVGTTFITRPTSAPGGWFPAVMRVSHDQPLLVEDWVLKVTRMSADGKDFDFEVTGSKTGLDGTGNSLKPFHSKSGRVILAPGDFVVAESLKTFKVGAAPGPGYEIKWSTVATYLDTYKAPVVTDAAKVYESTLAQGLVNGKHTLDLILNGDGKVPVEAIQIYRPPMH